MHILLASASPRRRELLANVGVRVDVLALDIDESAPLDAGPLAWVQAIARQKADAVPPLDDHPGPRYALTADTAVWLPQQAPLAKPTDDADARRMLRSLSGRAHTVGTAFCWVDRAEDRVLHEEAVCADVHMVAFSDDDIDAYVATDEPWDKAGAYGIQGKAGLFVERIDGDYFAIVGLPVQRVIASARALGVCDALPFGRREESA